MAFGVGSLKTFALAAVLGFYGASAVAAADLGGKPIQPPSDFAPPIAPFAADTPRWAGFYVAGMLGYSWGDIAQTGGSRDFSMEHEGALISGLVGYNWQAGSLVFGLEGEVGSGGLAGEAAGGLKSEINVLGALRGRLGVLTGPSMLIYGTAGLTAVDLDLTAAGTTQSQTFVGYQVGAGAEIELASQWSLRLEYIYTDLGKERVDFSGLQNTYDPEFHTLRAGLSIRF